MTFAITHPWALYNEIDEYAANWLENLIAAGLIARGIVDRRSIEDIQPDELRGFRQVHFFAGIGVWSYGLRRAGISDDTALWTGSCPCQPFSAAGKGGGMDDERHLWPAFFHHIRERRPERVLGEQVASKDGLGWLDLVCADMEAAGYAIGAVDTCSASSGAPHIRQRLRFAAYDTRSAAGALGDTSGKGPQGVENWRHNLHGSKGTTSQRASGEPFGRMADAELPGSPRHGQHSRQGEAQGGVRSGLADSSELGGLADADGGDASSERQQRGGEQRQQPEDGRGLVQMDDLLGDGRNSGWRDHREDDGRADVARRGSERRAADGRPGATSEHARSSELQPQSRRTRRTEPMDRPTAGPTNGFWGDADWVFCRDGKWRPIEPGTFPLAHGAPARVGRLRAYGNAVDAEATTDFIEAVFARDRVEIEVIARTGAAEGNQKSAFEDLLS